MHSHSSRVVICKVYNVLDNEESVVHVQNMGTLLMIIMVYTVVAIKCCVVFSMNMFQVLDIVFFMCLCLHYIYIYTYIHKL